MTSRALTVQRVDFVVFIPRGHDVLIAVYRQPGWLSSDHAVALDLTSGILYSDEHLDADAAQDFLLVQDPIAWIEKNDWELRGSTRGKVAGAVVSTKDGGDENHARTWLFLQATDELGPYR